MTGGRSRGRPAGKGKPFEPFPLPGLRAARLRAGETLEAMGAVIGVNKGHASKLELGQVRLDVERAIKLARHYGLAVERFPIADSYSETEPLSGWLYSAESVVKLMEQKARARFYGADSSTRPNVYSTDSGKLEASCTPDGLAVWKVAGVAIARAQARQLIAARMESRLS